MLLPGTSRVSAPAAEAIDGIGGSNGALGADLLDAIRMRDGLLPPRQLDVGSTGR